MSEIRSTPSLFPPQKDVCVKIQPFLDRDHYPGSQYVEPSWLDLTFLSCALRTVKVSHKNKTINSERKVNLSFDSEVVSYYVCQKTR